MKSIPIDNRIRLEDSKVSNNSYWEKSTPWAFKTEGLSYEDRRKLRYELQDYMFEAIGFDQYKGKKVLEIGCGAGIDSVEFARHGAIVTAIDFTENAVNLTKKSFREAGVKAVEVLKCDASELKFPDKSFDLVYSFGVLHHIKQIDNVLSDISRILNETGEGVFMVYNRDSLLNAYSILFLHRDEQLSEDELATRYSERNAGNPYTKLYSKKEAEELFGKYFLKVDVSTYFGVIDVVNERKVKIVAPQQLGWHHIVKCKGPIRSSKTK